MIRAINWNSWDFKIKLNISTGAGGYETAHCAGAVDISLLDLLGKVGCIFILSMLLAQNSFGIKDLKV